MCGAGGCISFKRGDEMREFYTIVLSQAGNRDDDANSGYDEVFFSQNTSSIYHKRNL